MEWTTTTSATHAIRDKGLPVIMRRSAGGHYSLAVDLIMIDGRETLGINDPHHSHVCRVVAANPGLPAPNTTLSCPTTQSELRHVTTKPDLDTYSGYSVPLGYYQLRSGDRSPSLQFFARDTEIQVANSQGLRTGFDPVTGQQIAEIPDSLYYDPSIVPPGEDPSSAFVRTLYIPNEADGSYTLTVTDGIDSFERSLVNTTQAATFSIEIVGYDELLNSVESTIVRSFEPGVTIQYEVLFDEGQDIQIFDRSYRSLFLPLVVR